MNSSLELTALRPIFGIGRMSTWSRSRSVRNRVIPSVFFGDVLELGRAGEQQDLLRLQRLGDPHLAAVDDVVASPSRLANVVIRVVSRPASGSVTPKQTCRSPLTMRGRFSALQLLGPVHDHRVHAEDRQVHGARAVHPGAGGRYLLEQQRRLGDAETVPAVLLRNGDAEPAAVGEGLVELGGNSCVASFSSQYSSSNLRGQLGDRAADRLLVLGELKVHREHSLLASLVRQYQMD